MDTIAALRPISTAAASPLGAAAKPAFSTVLAGVRRSSDVMINR
jgi:hypothetical protein